MGCKKCTKKRYEDNICEGYRGWFCSAGLWDERGNEEHKENDNDDLWDSCKFREI